MPIFMATCGLQGSGKTTVAEFLQKELGYARVSSNEMDRFVSGAISSYKEASPTPDALGLEPTPRMRIESYELALPATVEMARGLLQRGWNVVLDSPAASEATRSYIFRATRGADQHLLFLDVTEDERTARIRRNQGNVTIFNDRWEEPTSLEATVNHYNFLGSRNMTPEDLRDIYRMLREISRSSE